MMSEPLSFEDRYALEAMGQDLNSHVHHFVYHDPEHEEFDWRYPREGVHRTLDQEPESFDRPDLIRQQYTKYTNHPNRAVQRAVRQIQEFGASALNINRINKEKNRYQELHYLLNNVDSSNVPELHRAQTVPAENLGDMQRHIKNPESIEKHFALGQILNFGARSTTSDPNIASWWHYPLDNLLKDLLHNKVDPTTYPERALQKHLVTFHYPKQTRALQVVPLVGGQGQCEYILSPNQQFRVKDYGGQDDNLVHHFYLESK